MNEVIIIIGLMCGVSSSDAIYGTSETKIACIEHFTNCLIGPNGTYLRKKLNECQTTWKRKVNK